jgi:succinate dehydrogenase/fumarate reductase flavoprotein subunit
VILADKGWCGASGATAPSGTGVWYVPPQPELREEARASRESLGGFLSERLWMDRVLDRTYANMAQIAEWGYPFPVDEEGKQARRSLQGPEYMRLMRRQVIAAGVRILDHSPALELLSDDHGVAGAAGIERRSGRRWRVKANAVVIATGGCAFLSKALGCDVLTGDGGLMAAEVGADFSGMEFSNAYGISPAFASVTKTAFYRYATFYHGDGRVLEGAGSAKGRSIIARTLLSEPVFAQLDQAHEGLRESLRKSQPNFFLPFDKAGIDPLTQRFPVTMRLEGTVRGTGGIRLANAECATGVPGLYAAGDAATRELICGGFTGGGSHNAAWAMSSGYWAGGGAAAHARSLGASAATRTPKGAGRAALRSAGGERTLDHHAVVKAVQDEVFPYDRNLFRSTAKLNDSLGRLDQVWQQVQDHPADTVRDLVRGREAAAMTATARWMYTTARERRETRGMHKHEDFHDQDPSQRRRLVTSGIDVISVRAESGSGPVQAPAQLAGAAP